MRDRITELALLAFTAGGTGAALAVLFNTGFQSDDMFAFSGALIGAAGTLAGAAWLNDRTAQRDKRQEQALIRPELDIILDVANLALTRHPGEGQWTGDWRSSIHALGDIARGAGRFLDEVISHARTLDFSQRETIKLARLELGYLVLFYDDVFNSGDELSPMDERTWPSMISDVISTTSAAKATLRAR
jgi:hypothetical protein